jgi:hypothetical protein
MDGQSVTGRPDVESPSGEHVEEHVHLADPFEAEALEDRS